jgi:hypothetical protein
MDAGVLCVEWEPQQLHACAYLHPIRKCLKHKQAMTPRGYARVSPQRNQEQRDKHGA